MHQGHRDRAGRQQRPQVVLLGRAQGVIDPPARAQQQLQRPGAQRRPAARSKPAGNHPVQNLGAPLGQGGQPGVEGTLGQAVGEVVLRRVHQDRGPQELRVVHREVQHGVAAERGADRDHRRKVQQLNEAGQVLGDLPHAIAGRRVVAVTAAAPVDRDHAVACGQLPGLALPDQPAGPPAVHQQDGGTSPVVVVHQSAAVRQHRQSAHDGGLR